MKNFRFRFGLKNSPLPKLVNFVLSKSNDVYLFPPLLGSPLANSGLHISLHVSGESHITVQQFPVSCLGFRPKVKLPFNIREFVEDVAAKKQSLFSEIDLTNEQRAGTIFVVKSEKMVNNFLSSNFNKWLENPKYIDYYNLVKTNPYRLTSDFRDSFPYKGIEIDAQQIEQEIKTYSERNLYELFTNLRKNKSIEDVDMAILVPDNSSSFTFMSGTGRGLKIDLHNVEETIKKLPGMNPLYETLRRLI
jgi:hypothetical protein